MKIFIAGLVTETNTFSPLPTGLKNYEETCLYHGDATRHQPRWASDVLHCWRASAQSIGWQVVESLFAMAQPAGPTVRSVHEAFEEEILSDLKSALPVDAVLLALHGAMVADGCDDCEGRLLEKVRGIVGPAVPVGVELDLHCHLTQQMAGNATAIVIYKEYPHTDTVARAEELFDIIVRTLRGEIRPSLAIHDCRMIGIWPTTRQPMRGFVDRMTALEATPGVLSISLGHGFPWGDVADLGAKLLVVTDAAAAQVGASIAAHLGRELWELRGQIGIPCTPMHEAFERVARADAGPVVLADYADNCGGGAPGDSTFMLAEALRRGLRDGALSSIWDPVAVQTCFAAGQGARLSLRIGGKLGTASGAALDLEVEVIRLERMLTQGVGTIVVNMGDAAWVRCAGIDIVLNSVRTQTMAPDALTNLGIDPACRRFVIVKSMHHFHAGFAPLATQILYVETPGALSLDLAAIDYRKVRRPLWPRQSQPFAGELQ